MSGWKSRVELEHQVVLLSSRVRSQRQIARALGVTRGVVARILKVRAESETVAPSALPEVAARTPRPSKLDAHQDRIRELLTQFPAITAQRVLEELRRSGYQGSYTILKERVASLRPKKPPEPSRVRPPVAPGEEGEQDWSPHTIDFTASGKSKQHAFLLPLSHSRRRYLDFFDSENTFALLEGHRRAFDYFGGVPERIRYDWQKAVVVRREGPDIIYQPRLLAFATHYRFAPYAVRPYRPNDKAIVERDLWDVERSFLNGRRFRDQADLREQASKWLAEVVDKRRHPKLRNKTILEVFREEELPRLRPLPTHPFDTARVVYRLVSIEGFIPWEGNQYSVPYDYVTALLPVRITQNELFVYRPDNLECIAQHQLAAKGAGQQQRLDGHHPRRQSDKGAHLDAIREPFLALGDAASDFLCGLIKSLPRSAAYHARRILELRERYAAPDVAAALAHALRFSAFSSHAVVRIVEVRSRPRTLDEYVADQTRDRLRGLLEGERLAPRDLRAYDAAASPPPEEKAICPTDPKKTPSKPD